MSGQQPPNPVDAVFGKGPHPELPPTPVLSSAPTPSTSTPQNERRRYRLATELVHSDHTDQYGASSMPVYQSATFYQTGANAGGEYDYTRSGNPTRTQLERHLAKIIGCERVFAVSTGMSALDVITRVLRPGDEVVTGDDLYGGTNRLLKYLEAHNDIIVHHVDTTDTEAVRKVLSEKTAMALLETPTNPLIKVCDIRAIAEAAKEKNPACLVVVDNTMMSPLFQSPLELGADVSYESGTKYLSGHHDVMAGIIALNSPSLLQKFYHIINSTGCGLAPQDSSILLRGLKTLFVRMERQSASAQRIAEYLASHNFLVRYPGLKSHPQYAMHWAQATGAGAVLSFTTGDVGVSERIVGACRLWAISVSFGSVNSLISMPCRMSHASISEETRRKRGLAEDVIRLCVGIEDVEDLLEDLEQALVSSGAVQVKKVNGHKEAGEAVEGKAPIERADPEGVA